MGNNTLKIGDSALIKESQTQATIINIEHGIYFLSGSKKQYRSSDLAAVKKPYSIRRRPTKINHTSENTAVLKKIYSILRAAWLPHNKRCLAKFPCCTGDATEIHHMYKRTGFWLIMSKYFLPICRKCHKHATKNSKEAIEKGISISRNSVNYLLYDFNDYEKSLLKQFKIEIPVNN